MILFYYLFLRVISIQKQAFTLFQNLNVRIYLIFKKINKNYDNIESLCKPEIETLYDLTSGNIGKIHFLLERQEYVQWIKQITYNLQTQYDKQLNGIQLLLFKGQYILAKNHYRILKYNINLYFKIIMIFILNIF